MSQHLIVYRLQPMGYNISHVHHSVVPGGHTCGGGLAIIAADEIVIRNHKLQTTLHPVSFELQLVYLRAGNQVIVIVKIYRPPSNPSPLSSSSSASFCRLSISSQVIACFVVVISTFQSREIVLSMKISWRCSSNSAWNNTSRNQNTTPSAPTAKMSSTWLSPQKIQHSSAQLL